MPSVSEYQFAIETKKATVKTERIPYETAYDLAYELGRKGIHYKITEFDLRDNFERKITSQILNRNILL